MEGLTRQEAASRLAQCGPNSPSPPKTSALWLALRAPLTNPLVVVLLASAAVSASVGQRVDAALVFGIVLFSVALQAFQEARARASMRRLEQMVAPTASVLRDGTWQTVAREAVVPGDVVRLAAGDLVPADGRLTQERDLHVQEATLTGESIPAEKAVGDPVFLGTSVVSGTARMQVEKTGTNTALGGIAASLARRAPSTEFERGLRAFGSFIARIVLLLVGLTLVAMLGLGRPALESLLFAVALAVGLTPEFLPMITALTLSRGAVRMARHGVIVKNLASIQNLGSLDVLCSDKTGTLTLGEMRLDRSDPEALKWGSLNAAFQSGIASPLDAALLAAGPAEAGWTKIDEIPFDFERRRLSVVVERNGQRVLISKGAPESVLPLCDANRDAADRLAEQGYRVLAVAFRDVPILDAYGIEDEHELTSAGLLAFVDPPLPEAHDAIHRLRGAGVQLKVLTGDHPAVATHVCSQVGLEFGTVVLGSDVDRLTDEALQPVAERTTVFARMSPAQKNRVILALRARGHVVGYMGDGVNDAPSLHTADVGLSFAAAADVAKEAAQIVLTERSLTLLHKGVLEGRMAHGNVMKFLLMETSSNFGNVFSMAASALFLPFLPMLPTQILLNNLLYDLAQVTIPSDLVDPSTMRKPRRWDIATIRRFMLWAGPVSSLFDALTFAVLLRLFHAGPSEFRTGWFVESLATQCLVIFVVRTADFPWRSRPSRALAGTVIAIVGVGVALPFTPFARDLGFVALPAGYFVFLTGATLAYLAMVEAVKRRIFKAVQA